MINGILMVFAGVLCVFRFHFTWQAAIAFLFLGMLIVIGVHDQRTMEIPDRYNMILWGIGLISMLPVFGFGLSSGISLKDRILGFFIISLPMLVVDLMMIPGGFGGGDIKLMAAAGFFLGWRGTLLAAILAFAVAGIYSIFLLVAGRAGRKDAFAFGPFLCAGLAFSALYGGSLLF